MKKQSKTLFTQIDEDQYKTMTTVVNETLASGFNQHSNKIFSTADLWNIQRQKRTTVQRRYAL